MNGCSAWRNTHVGPDVAPQKVDLASGVGIGDLAGELSGLTTVEERIVCALDGAVGVDLTNRAGIGVAGGNVSLVGGAINSD